MGYSCTVAASEKLNAIACIHATNGNPNVLTIKGNEYFFERGRENADGAITGTLMVMLPDSYCRKVGGVKIAADGTIERFPFINKSAVEQTFREVNDKYPGKFRNAAALL